MPSPVEVVVLGSGCSAPPPSSGGGLRLPSGYAVRSDGRLLVMDFGPGNLRQMSALGLDPADVSHIAISHEHLDHMGEIPALLFHFRYAAKPRSGDLTILGSKEVLAKVRKLQAAWKPQADAKGYKLKLEPLEPHRPYRGPGWFLETLKVPHFVPAQALRLHVGDRRLVYSGDTASYDGLAAFARGADLFILECSQSSKNPLPAGHLTPKEALRLADLSQARRVLLSHLSAESAAEASRLLERRAWRAGRVPVSLAADGLRALL